MRRESIWLLTIIMSLTMIGTFTIYSALAVDPYGDAKFKMHLLYFATGLVLMAIAAQVDYHVLRNAILFRLIVCVSITLLILVLVPGIGVERNGAQRWIEFGGFQFQPSEAAKFALIVLLAVKLTDNQEHISRFGQGFLPALIIMITFAALVVLENDLGTPAVLCATAYFMFFVAGIRLIYLLLSLAPAGGVVYVLIASSEYRAGKLLAFLDPWAHDKYGYQLIQSMTAFVKGDISGAGAGAGEQKLRYLPEPDTDFILAVWAEEMGLIGTLLIVALFLALMYTAIRVANNARDIFGSLLATGIIGLISFQAAFNMAMAIGLLPTKGLPLPFISRGGTALLVLMTMAGILINIGLQAEAPKPKAVQPVSQT